MRGDRKRAAKWLLLGLAWTPWAGCAPAARTAPQVAPEREVSILPPDQAGEGYLRDTARAAQGSGAGPLQLLAFGAATVGDRVEGMVHVPEETCALFIARSTPQVDDLDLHIYADDGTQYGLDESPDDLPTLLLCPDNALRLYASARVAQGRGFVALGVQTVPKSRASAVSKAVGARNFSEEPEELDEPWPGLTESVERRRADLGGKWLDRRRVALPVDARVPTHLSVEIPADKCLDALLVPTSEISQLQVAALDDHGRIFARGQTRGRERTLLLCAGSVSRTVTLQIRPYAGRGLAVAALSVSAGTTQEVRPVSDVYTYHLDASSPPADLEQLPKATVEKTLELTRGQIISWTTRITGCKRIDLTAMTGLLGYQVEIWNDEFELLARGAGRGHRTLFVCGTGPVRIDAEASGRSGSLALSFRDSEQEPKGSLALPLATSRLIQEAYDAGTLTLPEDIGRMTQLELSDTRLTEVKLRIPAAHCQTVFVAGGHETSGLEGRIIDAKSELELDRAHDHEALTLKACAPQGGSLEARLELRTTTGKATALWASRQHKLKR